jgi:ABC-type glycerol-3-phosphate transport system substrate-binding protein
MQAAATAAGSDPANIGYMPFPSNIGGKQCVPAGGDYKMAINKNTKNMDAAKAWLSWFLDKSNFAFDQGGIPPLKGAALPATLADLSGATLISSNPAPTGKESFVSSVDNKSGVGLNTDAWKQRIVDAARGATTETFDAIVADLNAKWSAAWDTVTAGG